MKGFTYFMVWFLSIVLAITICKMVYLNVELQENNEKIDALSGVVSTLVIENMNEQGVDFRTISYENHDGLTFQK